MYRIREAGQLEPITALSRTFPDGISEQSGVVTSSAHAMPASKAGDDETGHAPPAAKDRLEVPAAIAGCLSVRFNRWRSRKTYSPGTNVAGSRLASAKDHIRNIILRQKLFDIS
ncbi:hypothetical protein [Burkholderia cepacia]|uniref:hypothetical protein n=1 Tax=Burkholderia cepacia TaxID=292 RepID=UPI000B30BD2C|nr:hypothetical protein [Burkholderia cepacia]